MARGRARIHDIRDIGMDLNILVRGQSNAILLMESNNWASSGALYAEVSRLLGFDGVNDRINLVYDRFDPDSATAAGGTALIGDWLKPVNGDWRQGWTLAQHGQAIVNEAAQLPAAQRDDPTAVLWLHSEADSTRRDLTPEEWISAVRFDAAQLRAALGQGAETTPYMFVSAMPYWGTEEGHQAIRQGMERLAADPAFNARIAARTLDTDVNADDTDGNWTTMNYGTSHLGDADVLQTVARAARSIAETFAAYAKPGSPVALAGGNIADDGPQVIRATPAGEATLRLDVAHDAAGGFLPLDPQAAAGIGWYVAAPSGAVRGVAAAIEDADTLLVTFSGPVPADGVLYYGYGYGRLAETGQPGRGNAVYDDAGLPIWVGADGLTVGATVAPAAGTPTVVAPGPAALPPAALPPAAAAAPPAAPAPAPAGPALPEVAAQPGAAPGERILFGGPGAERLTGGDAADLLSGGGGDDLLLGGGGSDSLRGGAGDDTLSTGAGADRIIHGPFDGLDRVTDFTPGQDVLWLTGISLGEVAQAVTVLDGVPGVMVSLPGGGVFLEGLTAPIGDLVFG